MTMLKDEEFARHLEYGEQQLLLSVTLILTWSRQLSNWCRPILTCRLTSTTNAHILDAHN